MSLLYLKNHTNAEKMMAPVIPVITRTHLNAPGSSNNGIGKFIPNIPATTPKIATTNVAVVSSSSNWISWFRTLSCKQKFPINFQFPINLKSFQRDHYISQASMPVIKDVTGHEDLGNDIIIICNNTNCRLLLPIIIDMYALRLISRRVFCAVLST